jgi:hypothetical protein
MRCTLVRWFKGVVILYTNAQVKPASFGARPVEIPPWLWFRYRQRRAGSLALGSVFRQGGTHALD